MMRARISLGASGWFYWVNHRMRSWRLPCETHMEGGHGTRGGVRTRQTSRTITPHSTLVARHWAVNVMCECGRQGGVAMFCGIVSFCRPTEIVAACVPAGRFPGRFTAEGGCAT